MALVSGYENELVEPPQDVQWECSICLLIVREPYMVSCCGQRFCRSCIEKFGQQGSPCPHCQKRWLYFTYQKDNQLKRLLMHKHVYCTNKNAGCQWVGELKDAEKHVRVDCMWTEVVCPNQCGQRFLRCKLNQHTTEECPRHPRLCEFAALGCDSGALTPNRLQDHMQRNMQQHLTLVCKKLEETKCNGALERSELEAKVVARDTKIMELERAMHVHENNPRAGELEAATQVYKARVGELEAVVEAREAKITELEATAQAHETKVLEAKLQGQQGEMKELQAKLCARQAKVKELEARVQDREARIRLLETSAEVSNEESESTRKAKEAQISELDVTVKACHVKIEKLTAMKQAHETKLGKVEAVLQNRDGEIRMLKTINDASEKKVGDLEATVEAREAAMEKLTTQLVTRDKMIQDLEGAVQTRNERIRWLEGTIQGHSTRIQELKAEIKRLRVELLNQGETIQNLEAEVEVCDVSIRRLEKMVQARDEKIKKLEAMVEDREARVGKLEATAQTHEARVAKLEKMVKYRDFVLVLLGAALLLLTVLLLYVSYCKFGTSTSSLILIQFFSFFVFMGSMACKYWSKYASNCCLCMVCRGWSEHVVGILLILYVLVLFETSGLYRLLSFGVNLAFYIIALYIEKKVDGGKLVFMISLLCICVALQNVLVLHSFLYLHFY